MQLRQITARYGRKRQPAQYESAEAMIEFTLSVDEDGQIGTLDIAHTNMGAVLLGQAKTLVLTELGVVNAPLPTSAKTLSVGDGNPGQTGAAVVVQPEPAAESTPPAPAKARRSKKETPEQQSQSSSDPIPQAHPPAPVASAVPTAAAGIPVEEAKQTESALGRSLPASAPGTPAPAQSGGVGGIPLDDTAASSPAPAAAQPEKQAAAGGSTGALTAADVQKYITQALCGKKILPPVVLGTLKADFKVDRVQDLDPGNLKAFYNKIRDKAGDQPIA